MILSVQTRTKLPASPEDQAEAPGTPLSCACSYGKVGFDGALKEQQWERKSTAVPSHVACSTMGHSMLRGAQGTRAIWRLKQIHKSQQSVGCEAYFILRELKANVNHISYYRV